MVCVMVEKPIFYFILAVKSIIEHLAQGGRKTAAMLLGH